MTKSEKSKQRPSEDYEVGYGRPPEASKFRKGHSGRGGGRPKGSRNDSGVEAAFRRKITVTDGGKQRKAEIAEALTLKLLQRAFEGDPKAQADAIKIAIALDTRRHKQAAVAEPAAPIQDSNARKQRDAQLLSALLERLQLTKEDNDDGRA
jgi:Family of unknown function (DUF5681)